MVCQAEPTCVYVCARALHRRVCLCMCLHPFSFQQGSPRSLCRLTQLMTAAALRSVSRARVFPSASIAAEPPPTELSEDGGGELPRLQARPRKAGQGWHTSASVCPSSLLHHLEGSLRSSSRFLPVRRELLKTRRRLAPLPLVLDLPARLFISEKSTTLAPPHPRPPTQRRALHD